MIFNSFKIKQKIFNPKIIDFIIILLIICGVIVINLRMIRDGLNGMTDMQWHIMWLQHFYKQLLEGIWYPRWLAGTNYGYGSPTFVFYPPFVYYLGSLFRKIGIDIQNTLIILYSLALFLSGFSCYLFCQNRYGKLPGIIGAFAYMTAPYVAYNLYWVSSLSVAFAIALIPLCWWLTDKALEFPKWKIGISIFWMLLALTHLPTLLLCGIVWVFYILFLLPNYSWKTILSIIFFAAIGLATSAFFLLPAILEQKYIDIASMKGVIGNIENGIFGLGLPFIPSRLDFQVSHILFHQSLVILLFGAINLIFLRSHQDIWRSSSFWLIFLLCLFLMMSSPSLPIWQASSILQKVQAPWRLFSIFSFGGAVLIASTTVVIDRLKLKFKFFLYLTLTIILMFNFSYSYKLSRKFPTFNNPGRANLAHLKSAKIALENPYSETLIDVGEYRPNINQSQPSPPPIIGQPKVSIIHGQADIEIKQWQSYHRIFEANITQQATIKIRTYYYPAWQLYVDNNPYSIKQDEDGMIAFDLEEGQYTIELKYQKTKSFIAGIAISLCSVIILIGYSYFKIIK